MTRSAAGAEAGQRFPRAGTGQRQAPLATGLAFTLAHPHTPGVIEGDGPGDGGIERADVPCHRQSHQIIATLAHQAAHPPTLAADYQCQAPSPIPTVVDLRLGHIFEPHQPGATLLERLHSLHGEIRRAKSAGWCFLAGLLAEGLVVLVGRWVTGLTLMPPSPAVYGLTMVIFGAFAGPLGWAITNPLLTVTEWSLFHFE